MYRALQFHECGQYFIGTHDETFSVAPDARQQSRSFVIRVYDAAGNVIETHEHKGQFKE